MGGNCESWKAPGDTELPSGYLTGSVPILLTDNCHEAQAYDAKISWKIGWIRNHMAMVDSGGVGFKCTEGNTANTMVHLSMRQSKTTRLTIQI